MNMNLPAKNRTVADLIDEYEDRLASVPTAIQTLNEAWEALQRTACVQGKYGGSIIGRGFPTVSERDVKSVLLKSGWKAVYDRCQIDMVASADDKRRFERELAEPQPLTFDNAKATFGDYLIRPRFHILRGLAEVFSQLDPAYKSHSKVKIGVKALPKRVILSNVGGYSSYGRDRLRDILNAIAAYQGLPLVDHKEFAALDKLHSGLNGHSQGEVAFDGSHYVTKDSDGIEKRAPNRGVSIRKFQNGNAHVFFSPATLLDVNRALAEFYGDVLPDTEEEDAKPRASTEVAKDLQFYWTPKKVIERLCDQAGIYEPRHQTGDRSYAYRVLEPSCGDGRILDELKARNCRPFGIEVHPGRAAEARGKGHHVLTANFLEQPAREEFDKVVMNPPFYGRHYIKHVNHALKFLKPGGLLVAVLPATAHYDHQELQGRWEDLPVASFAEAGTNVPTGILTIRKATA